MKVSELSARSGVPLSTIKYYIREGVLPSGTLTSPNQAVYGEEHLDRLDLIRALREVGGLSIASIRRVVAAMDAPTEGDHPLDVAFAALAGEDGLEVGREERQAAVEEVRRFLDGLPWEAHHDGGEYLLESLADALIRIRRYAWPNFPVQSLEPYARAMWALTAHEFRHTSDVFDPESFRRRASTAVRDAVLGTVLMEPIIVAMRRHALRARTIRTMRGLPMPASE